jgi:hypothetical protein
MNVRVWYVSDMRLSLNNVRSLAREADVHPRLIQRAKSAAFSRAARLLQLRQHDRWVKEEPRRFADCLDPKRQTDGHIELASSTGRQLQSHHAPLRAANPGIGWFVPIARR